MPADTGCECKIGPLAAARSTRKARRKRLRFRGDKPTDNGDNGQDIRARQISSGESSVIVSRKALLLMAVAAVALPSSSARAQWWSRAPADFEACADVAEKATTKEARISGLSECHSKFAGRRKPGGGYAYFDFMQNRSFDIAGPNPTPEEQRHIDEQYTAFLDRERQSRIASELAAKNHSSSNSSNSNFRSAMRSPPRRHPRPPSHGLAQLWRWRLRACRRLPPACQSPAREPRAARVSPFRASGRAFRMGSTI